jgi:HSF-type DNA-binding
LIASSSLFFQLMALMRFADEQGKVDKEFCVAWLPEGKSFVIRNPDEFARQVVPKFFKATKFSSFTRKLYRWGFRQINRGIGPDDPIIFGNEFFERDNEELMSKMRSVTAAGTRKTEQRGSAYGKRSFDGMYDGGADQKRFIFDHIMQQKAANLMQQNASLYGGMSTNGTMPLSNALRPGTMGGMEQGHHQQMMGMNKPYEMMPQGPPAMMNHQYNPMHQQQGMGGPNTGGNGQGYGNSQSTAEIVNAAIRALQFSS